MTARGQMTHRCRVLRPVTAGVDEYGHAAETSAPTVAFDALPCRAWSPTDDREVLDGSKQGVFGAVRMIIPLAADLTEADTVVEIVDRRGRVIFPGPLAVTAVTRRSQHQAVMLRIQRSSAS